MPNYSFLNLSPLEFEELSRDLLQKHLGMYLESFTNGRDGGIDFRHSFTKENELIIQCKRYKDLSTLMSALLKERNKVSKLNPKRYILTTSVGLTAKNKTTIQQLFNPFILTSADIFGKDDLNNLIGLNPEIEISHFKLWLSSINILDRILHSKTYNQSNFEKERINEMLRIYVKNNSYFDAQNLIQNHRYVIISGTPGIGKTTLGQILSYYYLGEGFEEFVFLSDSIDDAFTLYKEDVKQIFFFDDFLGRNFLDKPLSNNEEHRIVMFIEKISKSENKILIMTTREYILAQAKEKYEIFETPKMEIAKCIVDLEKYTKLVRARILYNHLFFSEIDEAYVNVLLEKTRYEKIIEHKNYNPRIIGKITKPEVWKTIAVQDFFQSFMDFLTYPESIWRHAFESQISNLAQIIMVNMVSCGTPILLDDLKELAQAFCKIHSIKYGVTFRDLDFRKALRELENTFIKISKDDVGQLSVDYMNPSIQDFLVIYLDDHNDFLEDIIHASIYFNQLFSVFSYKQVDQEINKRRNRISMPTKLLNSVAGRIINNFDNLGSSEISSITFESNKFRWLRTTYSDYHKMSEALELAERHPKLKAFVQNRFQKIIIPKRFNWNDSSTFMKLFKSFHSTLIYDPKSVINAFSENLHYLEQYDEFEKFETIHKSEYKARVEKPEFRERIVSLIERESAEASPETLETVRHDVQNVCEIFNVDGYEILEELEQKLRELEQDDEDYTDWQIRNFESEPRSRNENDEIRDMFDSLRNN